MSWYYFKPYVSVAKRQANAAREVAKMKKKGRAIAPVAIDGRTIAHTFWGKAWCDNLESYSDFENRLPRGRTYVRNGSVVDLQIEPGQITAMVSGSELYKIKIGIKPLAKATWETVKRRCAGQIGSLIELLQGKLSQGVMQIITQHDDGLFPKPSEIELDCSCPDWADMCKHVAASLYGVGARLDQQPELLFTLRQVNHLDLIAKAGELSEISPGTATGHKTIAISDLVDVFGIELDPTTAETKPTKNEHSRRKRVPSASGNGKPAKQADSKRGSVKESAKKLARSPKKQSRNGS